MDARIKSQTLGQEDFLSLFPNTRFRYIHDVAKTTVQGNGALDMSWNTKGYGTFFTVNGFPSIGKADETRLLSLNGNYVDFDVDPKLSQAEKDICIQEALMRGLEAGVPSPTVINRTQKGVHPIWLYPVKMEPTPENIAKWKNVQNRLVHFFKGDPACKDPSRVLRVPYTMHLKDPQNPFEIKVMSYKPEARHTLDEMNKAVPQYSDEEIASKKPSLNMVLAGLPIGQGLRHMGIAQVAGHYLRAARTPEAVELARLATYTWDKDINKSPEPQAERKHEIDNVIDGILKLELSKGNNEKFPESNEDRKRYQALLDAVPKDTPVESLPRALMPLFELLAAEKSLAEAELYIRNKIKKGFDLNTKDADSIVRGFKLMRITVQRQIAAAKKKAEQLYIDAPLTEAETLAAGAILKSPTLLYDALNMVKKLGVTGEERNVLLHYLIVTSRKLKKPLSATVKGESTAGKSHTVLTTIKMFPKSAYIDLTDATPQSFFYMPEGSLKHRTIVIFEKHGGERADYTIRTLQSEGKLKIQVTIKNPDTGQHETQTVEKEGPTGFITTTTASVIHSENDTRNISMFPDQSAEQTARVYESVDARYLGFRTPDENELKPWHHAQLCLKQLPVYIPFVKSFRKYFPKHILRTRRDYGHFLAIVETSAFLHQMQRERIEIDGQTYIRATLADAHIAKIVVEDSLSKSIYELPEKSIELIKAAIVYVEELHKEASNDKSSDESITFTITEISKQLGWDRDTVSKWMKPGTKKGYVTEVEESKGRKGAKYKLEEKDLPGDTFLPSIGDLVAYHPGESTEGVYDPITGRQGLPEVSTDAPMEKEGGQNVLPGDPNTNPDGTSGGIGAPAQSGPSQSDSEKPYRQMDIFELMSEVAQGGDGKEQAPPPSKPVLQAPDIAYSYITNKKALKKVMPSFISAQKIGLDIETTGLDPHTCKIRLVQLATDAGVVVVDIYRVDVKELQPLFDSGAMMIGHNLKFDLQFLMHAGITFGDSVSFFDTLLADQVLRGSRIPRTLKVVVEEYLGTVLDKTEQTAQWGEKLTPEMLAYAAQDAAILLPLYDCIYTLLSANSLSEVATLENEALPFIVQLELAGVPIQSDQWRALTEGAKNECTKLEAELNRVAGKSINWNSPKQVTTILKEQGVVVESTSEDALSAHSDHALVSTLLKYREHRKYLTTYGEKFLKHIRKATGRIHPNFRQIGADSGRMACSAPNMQNIPRNRDYRSCITPKDGRVLVKADYSQIELRIAAEISGDKRLIEAYKAGSDIHTLTAQLILGKGTPTKEDRQAAKAINFGLIYGMGAPRLKDYAKNTYGVELTDDEAVKFRNKFFAAYKGLRKWHLSQPEGVRTMKTLSGRKRFKVERFTEKLNTPVQGTCADGLKAALSLLWKERMKFPTAQPVLVVHDEIVMECNAADAPLVGEWLKDCMRRGMERFVKAMPVEVDVAVTSTWAK